MDIFGDKIKIEANLLLKISFPVVSFTAVAFFLSVIFCARVCLCQFVFETSEKFGAMSSLCFLYPCWFCVTCMG